MNGYLAARTSMLMVLASVTQGSAATAQLHWLHGSWCLSADSGTQTEETWLPPAGDTLFGISRSVREGKLRSFEFLRIALVDGVLTYLAQPGGRPPTAFKRVDGGDDWVRFENLAHDFPQQIEYRRSASGLRAQIAGPDGKGGQSRMSFEFQACAGPPETT